MLKISAFTFDNDVHKDEVVVIGVVGVLVVVVVVVGFVVDVVVVFGTKFLAKNRHRPASFFLLGLAKKAPMITSSKPSLFIPPITELNILLGH
ncbi:MAG: hypothetical protein AB8V23_00550 [Candidatus Midichloria sp.]